MKRRFRAWSTISTPCAPIPPTTRRWSRGGGCSSPKAAPSATRWDGFYIGGHAGISVPGIDFTNNTNDVRTLAGLAGIASPTATPLGNQDSTSKHFGGFVGYQQQWDGAIIGVEGNYNWLDKSLTATNSITGSFVPGNPALVYSTDVLDMIIRAIAR